MATKKPTTMKIATKTTTAPAAPAPAPAAQPADVAADAVNPVEIVQHNLYLPKAAKEQLEDIATSIKRKTGKTTKVQDVLRAAVDEYFAKRGLPRLAGAPDHLASD